MKSKSSNRLIIIGIVVLALIWALAILSTKAAQYGMFADSRDGDGIIDDTSILVVSGFALVHILAISLIFIGLIKLFLKGFMQSKSSILLGTLGLIILSVATFYVYVFIFGLPLK